MYKKTALFLIICSVAMIALLLYKIAYGGGAGFVVSLFLACVELLNFVLAFPTVLGLSPKQNYRAALLLFIHFVVLIACVLIPVYFDPGKIIDFVEP